MSLVNEMLREMFTDQQLEALDRVREELLNDPKALDTHSREVRGEQRPASS